MAAEKEGLPVDFSTPPQTKTFKSALLDGRHHVVQACLYLALRARLALIKAAVDFHCAKADGLLDERVVYVLGLQFSSATTGLYGAFVDAVEDLSRAKSFKQFPVFWRTFIFAWGGFFLTDRADEERKALSEQTGVSPDELNIAFEAMNKICPFPDGGSWFAEPSNHQKWMLKLVPPVVRGIGAFSRRLRYGKDGYGALGLDKMPTRNLIKDHNDVAHLLDEDVAVLAGE